MTHIRPIKEIDDEYLSVCAAIGHKQHHIQCISEQLIEHKKRLYELNKESDAASLKLKEEQEKPE